MINDTFFSGAIFFFHPSLISIHSSQPFRHFKSKRITSLELILLHFSFLNIISKTQKSVLKETQIQMRMVCMHIILWYGEDEWTMNQNVRNKNCVANYSGKFWWQKIYYDRYAIAKISISVSRHRRREPTYLLINRENDFQTTEYSNRFIFHVESIRWFR